MADDPYYREYMDRRNREGFGRFEPTGRQSTNDAAAKAQVAASEYALPQYGYRSDGYTSTASHLGDDPISAVRTLRSQMRKKMVDHEKSDRTVKAHLCQAACDSLNKTEGQLVSLDNQRKNALMVGDTGRANQLKAQMEQVKDDGIRNAYADLVTEDGQMQAYGVRSTWAPETIESPRKPATPQPLAPARPRSEESRRPATRTRTPEQRTQSRDRRRPTTKKGNHEGRFRPANAPVREVRRQPRQPSPDGKEAPRSFQSNRSAAPMTEYDPDIRRNDRLSEVMQRRRGEFVQPRTQSEADVILRDDPYRPPNQYGQCNYCDRVDTGFGRKSGLEKHYATDCPQLIKCRYCGKVVQVRELTQHYLERCAFLGNRMSRCNRCGLAQDREDAADGDTHPLCRGRMAPSGARWCPLCAVAVDDNKEAWKRHLQTGPNGCYNNPRLNGDEIAYEREREAAEAKAREEGPGGVNSKSSKTTTTNSKLNGAKLIDADQLIKALTNAQNAKKAGRNAKMKELENATPAAIEKANEKAAAEKAKEAAAAAAAKK